MSAAVHVTDSILQEHSLDGVANASSFTTSEASTAALRELQLTLVDQKRGPRSDTTLLLSKVSTELWRLLDTADSIVTTSPLPSANVRAALYLSAARILTESAVLHRNPQLWGAFLTEEILQVVGFDAAYDVLRAGLLSSTISTSTVLAFASTIYRTAPHEREKLIETFRSVDRSLDTLTTPVFRDHFYDGGNRRSAPHSFPTEIYNDWSKSSFEWAARGEMANPFDITDGINQALNNEKQSSSATTKDSRPTSNSFSQDGSGRHEISDTLYLRIMTSLRHTTDRSVYDSILTHHSHNYHNLNSTAVAAFIDSIQDSKPWTKQKCSAFQFLVEHVALKGSLPEQRTLLPRLMSAPALPLQEARRALTFSACCLDSGEPLQLTVREFRTHFPGARTRLVNGIVDEADQYARNCLRAAQVIRTNWDLTKEHVFTHKILNAVKKDLTAPKLDKLFEFLFKELERVSEHKRQVLAHIILGFCQPRYGAGEPTKQMEMLFARLAAHPLVSDAAFYQLTDLSGPLVRILMIARPWVRRFSVTYSNLREPSFVGLIRHPSLSDKTMDRVTFPTAPVPELRIAEVIAPFLRSASSIGAVEQLMSNGVLQRHVQELLLFDQVDRYPIGVITKLLRHFIEFRNALPGTNPRAWYRCFPVSRIDPVATKVDASMAGSSMAIIGGGAAGLTMAALRTQLGYLPESTTLFERRERLGGIWRQANVVKEGHNSLRPMSVLGVQLHTGEQRLGHELVDYLNGLEAIVPRCSMSSSSVTSVTYDSEANKFMVSRAGSGENATTSAFDSVLIATGVTRPKPLSTVTIPNNFDSFPNIAFIRWQKQIPPDDYSRFNNTAPVVIGLGNSALAMVGEFLKMREAGVNVRPRFLTHIPNGAIDKPKDAWEDSRGTIHPPIYRLRGDLSGIAGDVPHLEERFTKARNLGWFIGDVERIQMTSYAPHNSQMNVIFGNGNFLRINDVSEMFLLIGYQNNSQLLKRFGCRVDDATGEVDYNPITGQVNHSFGEDAPARLYVAGAAASRSEDRNQEVLPGMTRTIMQIGFVEMLHGYVIKPVDFS